MALTGLGAGLGLAVMSSTVLESFSRPAAEWFATTFPEPTAPQTRGLASDRRRRAHPHPGPDRLRQDAHRFLLGPRPAEHPTSSGGEDPPDQDPVHLSACGHWRSTSRRTFEPHCRAFGWPPSVLGEPFHEPQVALRTGDTPADVRRQLGKNPPDLLITTPESLYLMLTSKVRETLAGVETVIIDEIHALAATKRGAHLALTLERLERVYRSFTAAHRAVGNAATSGGDRSVPRRL